MSGGVAAFAVEKDGALRLLNQEATGGGGTCHVNTDKDGKTVLCANYGGGSVASFPVDKDGKLLPRAAFAQHTGGSVNPGRQKEPHAHSINPSPDGRFAVAADLGTDKIYVYKLDKGKGTITPHDPPFVQAPNPGAGPRHTAFHPNGRILYAINELDNTITAYRWDGRRGALAAGQTISTLPEGFTGKSSTAEVVVHPNGRFVYGSNRGHDSLAVFAIDKRTGALTLLGHTPTEGKNPRNFAIAPSGKWLIAANQDTGNLAVYAVEEDGARLRFTGQSVFVPKAVCVRFA
jgi:6-phosphogluconolactonase